MRGFAAALISVGALLGGLVVANYAAVVDKRQVGKQPTGRYLLATGQEIDAGTFAFNERLSDIAMHPNGKLFAVVSKKNVTLATPAGVDQESKIAIGADAGFHGVCWSKDGSRLYVSTAAGPVQEFEYNGQKLTAARKLTLTAAGQNGNPVPGGMCLSSDGTKLFVACADYGGAVRLDLATGKADGFYPAGKVPFGCALSADGRYVLISNWGGEVPDEDDVTMETGKTRIKINEQGSASSGTVTMVEIGTGKATEITTGLHPTAIAVKGSRAYVACAMSDTIDVIDIPKAKRIASWRIKTGNKTLIGSMPNAIAIAGDTLYSANGGDNAICEFDLNSGRIRGFRPAGFFPTNVLIAGDRAIAVNTKGNGSVSAANAGSKFRNTHNFEGTVSIIDLKKPISSETKLVSANNEWDSVRRKPALKVYNGAIKHIIYVIKENVTYDQVYGDMPEGNGDASLCSLGETVMPNHRKIAREFTLFDNAYTSGTNSADGHQWAVQAMANEYLEHFYVGYSRTYPDDGTDALAMNSTDRIWDAAMRKGLTARVYGEWADDDRPVYKPRAPKDWFEAWEDRKSGRNMFQYLPTTSIPSLRKILAPGYHYWPLVQSDQHRMDTFEKEFKQFEANGNLPNLIVMSLPCDHGEGANPAYPTPRAMMADNDLALGRLVELVSNSKYWKETMIVVIEDDSQSGPDHVDGHRTVCSLISPYTKRGYVSSEFITQVSLHASMGMMLGFGPLCKFDSIARPVTDCFTDTPNLTPYRKVMNNVPLDEPNPGRKREMTKDERYWYEKTMALDWSSMDRADPYWLNRINWFTLFGNSRPYPGRPGERPGMVEDDD